MWEICTREPPWNNLEHSWQIAEAINREDRLPVPPGNCLKSLIETCWEQSIENDKQTRNISIFFFYFWFQ